MVRDIIFRGKDIRNGEWVYSGYFKHINRTLYPLGDQAKDEDYISYIISSGFSDWNMPKPVDLTEIVPETVSQCTGMLDGNGRTIWENDVVTNGRTYGQVTFHNGAFKFKNEFGLWDLHEFNYTVVFNVIGNAIDDPELMEEKKEEGDNEKWTRSKGANMLSIEEILKMSKDMGIEIVDGTSGKHYVLDDSGKEIEFNTEIIIGKKTETLAEEKID